jgi:hypothetical protein
MTPGAERELAAAATVPEVREPRPYTSRYPIPEPEFVRLKERAHKEPRQHADLHGPAVSQLRRSTGGVPDELRVPPGQGCGGVTASAVGAWLERTLALEGLRLRASSAA